MGTIRQKKVAELIVENTTLDKPLNGGEIAENSGYSQSMQNNPDRVINTEGVKEELKALDFSESKAKEVVSSIMLNEEADNSSRLKASDQVFKVQGSYAPEKKDIKLEGTVDVNDAKANEIASKYEEEIKETL